MKLEAVVPNSVGKYNIIERTISLEPKDLIPQVNNFTGTVKQTIKNNILETIAVTGKAPTTITLRVFGDFSIMDFSKEIQLEIKFGVIFKIDQILFEFSMEMRKELIFEIVCTSEFRNQKTKSISKKNLGDLR